MQTKFGHILYHGCSVAVYSGYRSHSLCATICHVYLCWCVVHVGYHAYIGLMWYSVAEKLEHEGLYTVAVLWDSALIIGPLKLLPSLFASEDLEIQHTSKTQVCDRKPKLDASLRIIMLNSTLCYRTSAIGTPNTAMAIPVFNKKNGGL